MKRPTANLHKHKVLGYVGVYVDDLWIAGPRSLNDILIRAVQGIWKTSAPEHLGPDPDCVPVLRFLGMNLERVDDEKGKELDMPVGSILLSQIEYVLDVLMKFEPSLVMGIFCYRQVSGKPQFFPFSGIWPRF